ncbi:MAG: DUF4276 family protein [Thermoflexales bacterium]|nr:DUF4276 family protein [Thermoflexales bacterium]
MDSIAVLYFLEDIAHEKFVRALVRRVAEDSGIPSSRINEEVRNATGGKGTTLSEFSRFLRENQGLQIHVLVVAIDANCHKYTSRLREIRRRVKNAGIGWQVVCAIPDPHIERWYLADPSAIPRAFQKERGLTTHLPRYKCERGWYKQALRRAIEDVAGFVPPLGGVEYGQDIAGAMDLYTAGRDDRALKHFIDDIKQVFTVLKESRP